VELVYVQTRVEGMVTGTDEAYLRVMVMVRVEQEARGTTSK
jgi:hypothetical protein